MPTTLRLNYSLANTNGAFFFLQNYQLNDIFSAGQVIASGIAASNPVGTIDVPLPTNSAAFFGMFQDPALNTSPTDFIAIDDGDVPEAPATLLLESPNLPDVLPANSPFLVTFQISDISGNRVSTNGQIALSLENGDGTPVTFAYTLLPVTVGVTNGVGQANLTIQTTNSIADVFLAGKFSGQVTGQTVTPLLRDATTGPQVGRTVVTYADFSDPDTISWHYPLPAVVPLSGAFGEWPGHSDLHYGIDFAATVGTSVLAAKKGVVIKVNDVSSKTDMGSYVAVYHGNGYITRYLHINPKVKLGSVVTYGQVIGTVHNWAHPHLHFEMLQLNNPAAFNSGGNYRNLYNSDFSQGLVNFPGIAVSPIGNPAFTFSSTLFASGGQKPTIPAVFFRSSPPATKALFMDSANPSLERLSDITRPSPVYVVLQVVEQTTGGVLPPKQITFMPEGGTATNIIYGLTQTDIEKLHRRLGWIPADGAGYALLPQFESDPDTASAYRSRRYKYWFSWDTSVYASSTLGPHSFTVQSTDLAGNSATPITLSFGPRILANGQPLGVLQTPTPVTIPINYRFGPLPNGGPTFLNRLDVCQCSISVTPTTDWDVQFLPAAGQTSPSADRLSFDIFGDNNQVSVNVQVTPKVPQPATGTLTLTAESFVLPGIHDQVAIQLQSVPSGMALILAGNFTMGDSLDGDANALPLHSVYVSAFYMDKFDVTFVQWQQVYNWAIAHGYSFDNVGSGKSPNHPVQTIDWYDSVKWCNARSEMEGRTAAYYTSAAQTTVYRSGQVNVDNSSVKWNSGYRLPTEAEWEKAARGGASGQRFPWGNTINESQANYYAYPLSLNSGGYSYDVNSYTGYNVNFATGNSPYTSPVGYFAPNGYGLYDMAGNVQQWCWDWYGSYGSASQTDPRGAALGSSRVFRGGSYYFNAIYCRSANRFINIPFNSYNLIGFRSVLPPGQ